MPPFSFSVMTEPVSSPFNTCSTATVTRVNTRRSLSTPSRRLDRADDDGRGAADEILHRHRDEDRGVYRCCTCKERNQQRNAYACSRRTGPSPSRVVDCLRSRPSRRRQKRAAPQGERKNALHFKSNESSTVRAEALEARLSHLQTVCGGFWRHCVSTARRSYRDHGQPRNSVTAAQNAAGCS